MATHHHLGSASQLAARAASLARAVAERPLSPLEFVFIALVLVAGFTLYCVLYCLIAFSMHGGHMPLAYSAGWAVHATLPWLLALEVFKRTLPLPRVGAAVALLAFLLLATIFVAIGLERAMDAAFGLARTRSFSLRAAAQLPALIATAAIAFRALRRTANSPSDDAAELAVSGDQDFALPPAEEIDWIEAAGNYIEIHFAGRSSIRRLTMRQAEALVDPARFVRIHRSIIVSRRRIASVGAGGKVRLDDGTLLKVGDAYRRNLRAPKDAD